VCCAEYRQDPRREHVVPGARRSLAPSVSPHWYTFLRCAFETSKSRAPETRRCVDLDKSIECRKGSAAECGNGVLLCDGGSGGAIGAVEVGEVNSLGDILRTGDPGTTENQ